jgi:hypothetical protein
MMDAQELRGWVNRYLRGDVSLRGFQDWFVPELWELESSVDPIVKSVALDIELRLAEYTNGHLPESELATAFRAMLDRFDDLRQSATG